MLSSPNRRGTLTIAKSGNLAAAGGPDEEPAAPAGRVVLASAPKIRSVYWCRFWTDALRPEFYKTRPVVIVSHDNRLDGPPRVVRGFACQPAIASSLNYTIRLPR